MGTGAIDGTQVDAFNLEVFQNSVSQGTWTLGVYTGYFNFNFNTTTKQFIVGASSLGTEGQIWGQLAGSGVGFGSGSGAQVVFIDGSSFGSIPVSNSTLTATEIPEPAPVAGILGLTVLAVVGRKRK